jgi:pantoate--beta-alanine ligase
MLVLHSPQVVQEMTLRWRRDAKNAFVPTMGCLHEGHLKLVETARRFGQKTIVSIFVNPLQFGPNEDFEKYPRQLATDVEMLEAAGVDLVFAPSPKDFYPAQFRTRIQVQGLSEHLCGKTRPGHFEGVATVCLKLFEVTSADFAIFGEKDFQQLRILQTMAADLNLPLAIVPEPIVREESGLALSSRNRLLSPTDRNSAERVPLAIKAARQLAREVEDCSVGEAIAAAAKELAKGALVVDYLSVAPEETLIPEGSEKLLKDIAMPRLFIAVKAGSTRLIDNVSLRGI